MKSIIPYFYGCPVFFACFLRSGPVGGGGGERPHSRAGVSFFETRQVSRLLFSHSLRAFVSR